MDRASARLIPVNIVGLALSVVQALTGRKTQFARTPMVEGRTRVPVTYLIAELSLLVLWCDLAVVSLARAAFTNSLLMLVHAVFLAYAIAAFIGYRNALSDIVAATAGDRRVVAATAGDRREAAR